MVMLETPTYFKGRWTREEFGRALSKNIGVLRVQWPDTTPSTETHTCSRVEIIPEEVDTASGALAPATLERIADQLERFRSLSFAVRRISAMTPLTTADESIQGKITGVGSQFTMHLKMPTIGRASCRDRMVKEG